MQNAKCKGERTERQARLNTMPSERSISAADKNAKALCQKKNEKKIFFFIFSTHNYFLFPLAPYLLYRAYG